MRQLLAALALVAVLGASFAAAEVWNDPSGFTAGAATATITFPRAFRDVLVHNDDAAESIHIRLFWCDGETIGDAATTNLEIKATKSRSFTYYAGENGTLENSGYCAMTHIRGGTVDVAARVEGK
ncbi:hypothetical protein LCGC14_2152410 [marine sediment metagenome]|uniref:Uncharacterized protein n=1 Tax=marine sediment metagenome TaxID=412755 RepID=A0A0F9EHC2_9ZZZZ